MERDGGIAHAAGWRRPMTARDPAERHRGVSPLELFFDLCFVVAIAQSGSALADAVAAGGAIGAVTSYLTVFFAIWWAWMNFTWFASAFDNDDVPCRLAVFVQIAGALVLAAGTTRAFAHGDFDAVFLGYAIMRTGLIALWLRAARASPVHRPATRRYAIGLAAAMAGWSSMLIADHWPLWGWCVMAAVELAIPVWAESRAATPWNPHHIARRYGRFVIIVLGQSVLALANAVRVAVGEHAATLPLVVTIGSGLLIVFSLWWIYFDHPADALLRSRRAAFAWGYGHYFVLAAAAAVGVGLAINVQHVTSGGVVPEAAIAATVTLPVAVFLGALWLVQVRPWRRGALQPIAFGVAVMAVLAATPAPWAVPLTAAATAALAAVASVAAIPRPSSASDA